MDRAIGRSGVYDLGYAFIFVNVFIVIGAHILYFLHLFQVINIYDLFKSKEIKITGGSAPTRKFSTTILLVLLISLGAKVSIAECLRASSTCNSMYIGIPNVAGNISYYDIRIECVGSLCYDFSNMEYDLICNWLGNSNWVHAMEWNGGKDFVRGVIVSIAEAGQLKNHGPLGFLMVDYIPDFASRVHKGNKNKEGIHINLKGFAIDNALANPAVQFRAYTDYALENKLIQKSDHKDINQQLHQCERTIHHCAEKGEAECLRAYSTWDSIFDDILNDAGNINYYDIKLNFSNMEKFLNLKSVRQALGVGNIEFISCRPTVYSKIQMDWMKNLAVGIPALLNDGIKLLVYAREYDLICNWLGNSNWVHAMEWNGGKDFVSFVSYFLKVHYMVPMDQPKAALEMLKRWTRGKLTAKTVAPAEHTKSSSFVPIRAVDICPHVSTFFLSKWDDTERN